MTRAERLARYQRELAALVGAEDGCVVFEDLALPGRVVQIAFGIDQPSTIEATNAYQEAESGGVNDGQAQALRSLGFDTAFEPFPSRAIEVGPAAAEAIDDAFMALGAAADFSVALYAAMADDRSWSDG